MAGSKRWGRARELEVRGWASPSCLGVPPAATRGAAEPAQGSAQVLGLRDQLVCAAADAFVGNDGAAVAGFSTFTNEIRARRLLRRVDPDAVEAAGPAAAAAQRGRPAPLIPLQGGGTADWSFDFHGRPVDGPVGCRADGRFGPEAERFGAPAAEALPVQRRDELWGR